MHLRFFFFFAISCEISYREETGVSRRGVNGETIRGKHEDG